MSKTETKKQYWQRIAKEQGVKYQDNDTIGMLVTAIAAKIKIDSEGFSPSGLQKAVNKKLTEMATPKGKGWQKGKESEDENVIGKGKVEKEGKKSEVGSPKTEDKKTESPKLEEGKVKNDKKTEATESKKADGKKPVLESKVVKEDKPELGSQKAEKKSIALPDFSNIKEMKDFCVEKGLNLLDGYVSATKQKQVDFLAWITNNASKIKQLPKNNIDAAKKIVGGFEEIAPKTTSEIPVEMVSYAKSIMGYIKSSPALAIHRKFPKEELKDMLSKALKHYNYSVDTDGVGSYITMTDNHGHSVRIPEHGYLPM